MAEDPEDVVIFYKGDYFLIKAKDWKKTKPLNEVNRDPAQAFITAGGIVGNIPLRKDGPPGGYSVVVNLGSLLGKTTKRKKK
jgi:hypothetical protein